MGYPFCTCNASRDTVAVMYSRVGKIRFKLSLVTKSSIIVVFLDCCLGIRCLL